MGNRRDGNGCTSFAALLENTTLRRSRCIVFTYSFWTRKKRTFFCRNVRWVDPLSPTYAPITTVDCFFFRCWNLNSVSLQHVESVSHFQSLMSGARLLWRY